MFKNKRVLDIGCHVGALTLQIAANFDPAQVLGVDIDESLVKSAITNLKRLVNRQQL